MRHGKKVHENPNNEQKPIRTNTNLHMTRVLNDKLPHVRLYDMKRDI